MNTSSDQRDQSQHNYLICVAGLNTLVSGKNKELIIALQNRYSAYSGRGEHLLEVNVEYVGQRRSSSLLDQNAQFEDGICYFHAPGFEGFVDSKRGEGELVLSSKRPLDEIDYYLRVAYALLSFDSGGLMFHAAGLVRNGQAYLFFGHSGSGKTTVARVSKSVLVLNDDLLILAPATSPGNQSTKWIAYATPFWNPTQVAPTNHCAPVTGLYRLVQDQEVYLEPMKSSQALAEMVSNIPVIPDDLSRGERLLKRCSVLIENIPVYYLHFLPDSTFWGAIDALSQPSKVDN